MGFTLSFDASTKAKKGDVRGLLHHVARDVDKEQGREVRHSNELIDGSRTADNETGVWDDKTGDWEACTDTRQIEQALSARLATVTKPLRKDAVVLRPLIIQLDPEWYAAHQSEDERDQAALDMMEWAGKTVGPQNLVYVSRHQDESNEHLHMGFCPVTEDGRLSQKDWFSSPARLREMHQDFREFMRDKGYDIELERKKPGKHAKRLPEAEYRDYAELERQRRELADREAQLAEREREARERAAEAVRRAQEAREATQEAKEAGEALRAAEEAYKAAEGRLSGGVYDWLKGKQLKNGHTLMDAYLAEQRKQPQQQAAAARRQLPDERLYAGQARPSGRSLGD